MVARTNGEPGSISGWLFRFECKRSKYLHPFLNRDFKYAISRDVAIHESRRALGSYIITPRIEHPDHPSGGIISQHRAHMTVRNVFWQLFVCVFSSSGSHQSSLASQLDQQFMKSFGGLLGIFLGPTPHRHAGRLVAGE